MHFASEIYRPPYEARIDEFLQVTAGCSHNSCAFCPLYRKAKFRIPILGNLPEDKNKLIKDIQSVIETADFEALKMRRKNIRQL